MTICQPHLNLQAPPNQVCRTGICDELSATVGWTSDNRKPRSRKREWKRPAQQLAAKWYGMVCDAQTTAETVRHLHYQSNTARRNTARTNTDRWLGIHSCPHQLPRLIDSPKCALEPPAMACEGVVLPISHCYETLELDSLRRSNGSRSVGRLWSAVPCVGCTTGGRGHSRRRSHAGRVLAVHSGGTCGLCCAECISVYG